MTRVTYFDPSIRENDSVPNYNLGDLVIRDAIRESLVPLFPGASELRVSTHLPLSWRNLAMANASDHRIVCGTNLLSSRQKKDTAWRLTKWDTKLLRPVILCGVGWWSDQKDPDEYTRWFFDQVLSRDAVHSVRDSYSKAKLEQAGFDNVINTSCPTMWSLSGKTEDDFPKADAQQGERTVLTTLSWWRRDGDLDQGLMELLKKHYEHIVLFPQGLKDADLMADMGIAESTTPGQKITILPYSYDSFQLFFEQYPNADYLGLRLHAGIRCLQKGLRSLIVEVDNRAREISNDTGLPTVKRDDYEAMEKWIAETTPFSITLDQTAIDQFLNQFRS